jgi:transposase InsO family protein
VSDITEHPTREGRIYCAVVLDVYSRRVLGWSIDASQAAALVTNALGMAIDSRHPAAGDTLIHSDHGVQFTSWAFGGQMSLITTFPSFERTCSRVRSISPRGLICSDSNPSSVHTVCPGGQ